MCSFEADIRDLAKALGAHIGHVDARRQRAEGVIGSNVGGGPLPAYVLLARGEGEHKAPPALCIARAPDQAARKPPHELLLAGDKADMRTSVAWGKPKPLALAGGNVRAVLSRRGQDGEADRVDASDCKRARSVRRLRETRRIHQKAEEVGLLEHHGRRFGIRLRSLSNLDSA